MDIHFFEQLLAIMAASLVCTIVLQRLKLPSIVAYLIAGSIIGPHVLGLIAEPDDFVLLAEFGVVFLLFALGLEFSLPKLMALRSTVFGLGGIQVAFCSAVFGGAVWMWGTTPEAAIIIAGALALSSTAIVTKELGALRQVHQRHGQLAIGVLLFQDLVAVVFLILVPVLAGSESASLWSALGWALLKGIALMAILLGVGKWILPVFYKEVASAQSEEVFVLSTLVIVLLAAWVTHSFHLSMALGGFVIGMMLGESHYRHQINNDIRGFKDILLGLFFVTIGMNVQVDLLIDYWPRLLFFTAVLVLLKTLLIALLVRLFGDDKRTALQTGLSLAQAGEFGLALLALGLLHGLLPRDQVSFIILVAILSMALSPFLIRYSERISGLLGGLGSEPLVPDAALPEHIAATPRIDHVIIGGFGRVGQTIAGLLEENGVDYIAIDRDAAVVAQAHRAGHRVLFGDCTKLDMLHSCHIDSAKLAVLTFHSIELARNTIEHIRAGGINVPIIVRSCEHGDFHDLIALGADQVVPEMLDASLGIGAQVLRLIGIEEREIEQQIDAERQRQMQL